MVTQQQQHKEFAVATVIENESEVCVPACLILSQQQSPAQQDASPIPPSTGTEQEKTQAVTTTSHKTHTPFSPIHKILGQFSPEMNKQHVSLIITLKHLLVHSSESFVFTLAVSLNFSCSGLLCSSYRTTPSGPLADAVGLPSPVVLLRLPLATSSWVSRRLLEEKET